jgi:transcriptional regulator with XRE-family HTH domain
MDTPLPLANHAGMPAKARPQFRKLYIGEWIARLNLRAEHIAQQVGIGPSYLSMLISGKKGNPSGLLLLQLSEAMGMTVNDLYKPPPGASQLEAVKGLSPDLLNRLLEQQRLRK